jgi:hypothetical protein
VSLFERTFVSGIEVNVNLDEVKLREEKTFARRSGPENSDVSDFSQFMPPLRHKTVSESHPTVTEFANKHPQTRPVIKALGRIWRPSDDKLNWPFS